MIVISEKKLFAQSSKHHLKEKKVECLFYKMMKAVIYERKLRLAAQKPQKSNEMSFVVAVNFSDEFSDNFS